MCAAVARPVRWGIMGTANIARSQFLPGVRYAGGTAQAVASRDDWAAERYAAEHGIARALTGYQAIIDDPDVDALYIALPNSLHAEWTIAALQAGRPVLCEKPLTGNAEPSFSAAIRHIQAVVGGTEEPRQLVIDTSLPTAQAIHDLHVQLGP